MIKLNQRKGNSIRTISLQMQDRNSFRNRIKERISLPDKIRSQINNYMNMEEKND